MSPLTKRLQMDPHVLLWGAGMALYTIASDFVPVQSVVDILDRLALLLFAAGAVMAWRSGHRGSAWLLGGLSIMRAVLGTPEVVQRSAAQLWFSGALTGLLIAMILASLWAGRRPQSQPEPAN